MEGFCLRGEWIVTLLWPLGRASEVERKMPAQSLIWMSNSSLRLNIVELIKIILSTKKVSIQMSLPKRGLLWPPHTKKLFSQVTLYPITLIYFLNAFPYLELSYVSIRSSLVLLSWNGNCMRLENWSFLFLLTTLAQGWEHKQALSTFFVYVELMDIRGDSG